MKTHVKSGVLERITTLATRIVETLRPGILPGIALLAAFLLAAPIQAAQTVYVTADNLNGTNLFGTLDLRTGRFTQIAQTTPLFYALAIGPGNHLYGTDINTGTVFMIGHDGSVIPYGSITAPGYFAAPTYGFFGLVYQAREDDFLAVNVDPVHVSLYRVADHASKLKDLGIIEGPDTGIYFSGSLAVGPEGKLYFDFIPPTGPQLYTIDPRTGAPTAVGKGLGTDILTLFSDGSDLYGIDTDATTDIGIYVINRKSGVAVPTGVTVRGLPKTNDFYIDTATFSGARCE